MLLKLIPLPTQPTIHFSIALPTFPSQLDTPQSYTSQLNHLVMEDLDVPDSLHALDKSVGLMSLLDQVVFEIKDGGGGKSVLVTCHFVDGALEEWITQGTDLIFALDSIIHNVQESTLEDDKERHRYQLQNRSRVIMSPAPATKPRHKKQRSFFMQFVSSIVNLTSSSSCASTHLPTFADSSYTESFHSPSPSTNAPLLSSNRSRSLRRIARSNLVNTYRKHVLPELTRRFPKEGGYCVWILHSMRRRAWERMQDLIQEGNRLQQQALELRHRREHDSHQERPQSPIPMDEHLFSPRFGLDSEEVGFSATTMNAPLSFSDEDSSTENVNVSRTNSDDGDLETTTDGSSVRTPSSSSDIGPGFMGGSSSGSSPTTTQSPPLPITISLSNSQPCLPSHFVHEYNKLSRLRHRLQSLILFADSQMRIAEDDKRNLDEILLVRGKRRAWLSGKLARDSTIPTSDNALGYAAPFKSSPLARYSWSASAELDDASNDSVGACPQQQQVYEEEEDEYDEFHGPPAVRNQYAHGRQSRQSRYSNGGKKLAPVTEEYECEDGVRRYRDGSSSFLYLHDGSSRDGFAFEDPRELDLEMGFGDGLMDRRSSTDEEEEEEEYGQRKRGSGESSRSAFEMERPKVIPRVRDGVEDETIPMMASSRSSSVSARSGGLLSWGYWAVGKHSATPNGVRRCRSWKSGIGLGGSSSRGRSLDKTWQGEFDHSPGADMQAQEDHAPPPPPPRLRSRRHKREYQYRYPRQRQYEHVYGDEVFDECDGFEVSGYGPISGGFTDDATVHSDSKHHQQQHHHNSMIHARLHLDELLMEEGLYNNGYQVDDMGQEEFTLAMDTPHAGGRGGGRGVKARKMQYSRVRQNRDSEAVESPRGLGYVTC